MKPIFAITFILILNGCSTQSKIEERVISCEILKQGIYGYKQPEYSYTDKNTTTGQIQSFNNLTIVEKTSKVPLTPNVHFGVKYEFWGLQSNQKITEKVTHPEFSKPGEPPSTGYKRTKILGSGSGYILNREYELVEGEWKFEYYYQGKRLCGAVFNTYKT